MKTLSNEDVDSIKKRAKKHSARMIELEDKPGYSHMVARSSGIVQALEYVLILLDEYDEDIRRLP
jgi:hypothetical protein